MFGENSDLFTGNDTLITMMIVYAFVAAAFFWLSITLWTYRDMRARSRDLLALVFVTLVVGLLNFPGLLIYLFLRPRETLSEAYERSLEEEALLQEIEEKPSCPGCGHRVQDGWQVCPNCHTRLKKVCIACRKLLELSWNLCPYCAAPQAAQSSTDLDMGYNRQPTPGAPSRVSLQRQSPPPPQSYTEEALEFIDGDDYGV